MDGVGEAEGEVAEGDLLCWGCGEFGQHCHGNQGDVHLDQGRVTFFSGLDSSRRVRFMDCGSSHNVVVSEDNEVFVWGNGNSGQLGLDSLETRLVPATVELPGSGRCRVAGVSCGGRHTMIWISNGHVYGFGNNFYAQLGYDFTVKNYKENQLRPTHLYFLQHRPVRQVACGDKHTLFLFRDGNMAATGNNAHGQIGSGDRSEACVPKMIEMTSRVLAIAAGTNHNLALTEQREVHVWGYCKGCGERRQDVLSPTPIFSGHHVTMVAAGTTHSMALTGGGNVYTWGSGVDGQLGHGKRMFLPSPRKLRDQRLSSCVVHISCGEAFSAAVTVQGQLFMWGKNSHTIMPEHSSSFKVLHPVCMNPHSNLKVRAVVCGAWHAALLAGPPDPLSAGCEESEEEDDDDEDEEPTTIAVLQQETSVLGDFPQMPLEQEGEATLEVENVAVEAQRAPVEHQVFPWPRDKTKLTLAEFYASSSESRKGSSTDQSHVSSPGGHHSLDSSRVLSTTTGTPRSNRSKQLVVQVPRADSDSQSSRASSARRSQACPDTPSERGGYSSTHPPPVEPVPPEQEETAASGTGQRLTSRTELTRSRAAASRMRSSSRFTNVSRARGVAMETRGRTTVQVSSSTADNFSLPREKTGMATSSHAVTSQESLRTGAGESQGQANGEHPPGERQGSAKLSARRGMVSVQRDSSSIPVNSPLNDTDFGMKISRSQTFFGPLQGHMPKSINKFFTRRHRRQQPQAFQQQYKNTRTLNSLMRTLGRPHVKPVANDGLGTAPYSRNGEVRSRKPIFSSATSWKNSSDLDRIGEAKARSAVASLAGSEPRHPSIKRETDSPVPKSPEVAGSNQAVKGNAASSLSSTSANAAKISQASRSPTAADRNRPGASVSYNLNFNLDLGVELLGNQGDLLSTRGKAVTPRSDVIAKPPRPTAGRPPRATSLSAANKAMTSPRPDPTGLTSHGLMRTPRRDDVQATSPKAADHITLGGNSRNGDVLRLP